MAVGPVNTLFATPEPVAFQLAEDLLARKKAGSPSGENGGPPSASSLAATSVLGVGAPVAPPQSTAPTPTALFQNLQSTVASLGSLLSSGQNVTSALTSLASVLANFANSLGASGSFAFSSTTSTGGTTTGGGTTTTTTTSGTTSSTTTSTTSSGTQTNTGTSNPGFHTREATGDPRPNFDRPTSPAIQNSALFPEQF